MFLKRLNTKKPLDSKKVNKNYKVDNTGGHNISSEFRNLSRVYSFKFPYSNTKHSKYSFSTISMG